MIGGGREGAKMQEAPFPGSFLMYIPSVSMEGRFPFGELRNEIFYVAIGQDWAGIILLLHLYDFDHRNTKGQETWPITSLTLPRAEDLDSMEAEGSHPLIELVFCMFSFVLSFPICKM